MDAFGGVCPYSREESGGGQGAVEIPVLTRGSGGLQVCGYAAGKMKCGSDQILGALEKRREEKGSNRGRIIQRIDNANRTVGLPFREIFRIQDCCAGPFCSVNDERIPE